MRRSFTWRTRTLGGPQRGINNRLPHSGGIKIEHITRVQSITIRSMTKEKELLVCLVAMSLQLPTILAYSRDDAYCMDATSCSASKSDDLNISQEEFNFAVTSNNYPQPQDAQYTAFINGIPKSGITSKRELAMFLSQILHESMGLTALSELACANNGCPGWYDWWNGHQFFGRGYIQLTWKANYAKASEYLYGDANVLLNDPESVATNQDRAWDVSFWYWKANVHDAPGVQDGQFGSSTKAINGAIECSAPGNPAARARYNIYQKVFSAFGISGSPDPAGCA